MGQFYSITFTSVAVAAQQDLFAYVAPAAAVAVVHSVEVSLGGGTADFGDAQAEGLAVVHKRGATTAGSVGTVATPVPLEAGFVAARGSARVNDTTIASAGTIVTVRSSNWSVQSPYLWLPTPELRHVIAPGVRYVVGLAATPADSLTVSGEMIIEEVG